MKLARTNALIPMPTSSATDTYGKEGYPVDANSDGTVDLCADATGNPPFGVIVLGAEHPGKVTVAVAAGGLAGTVRVKLLQAVMAPGALLKLVDSAGVIAFGPDTGTGARVVMAQALETGAANELIEAVLFKPISYAS
jgi:hypothetical protein